MINILKQYNKCIRIFLVFTLFILINSVNASTSEYSVQNYEINAKIMNNGNIHIEELLQYNFNEAKNGVYRDILYRYTFSGQKNDMKPTSLRYQADDIQNLKVYTSNTSFDNMKESALSNEQDLYNGIDGYYSISNIVSNPYTKNIKVYTPAIASSSKYIKYEYDIIGAVVKYNDAAEIYWNFLGKDWECDINNLKVNVSFENEYDLSNVKTFIHSYNNVSDALIGNGEISFTCKNVNVSQAIDARIIFPSSFIGYSSKIINENYNYEELNNIENQMNIDKENYFLSNRIFGIIVLGSVISFVVVVGMCISNYNKKMPKEKNIDYYKEPLDNLRLDEYNTLKNRSYSYYSSYLLISTILDLSNKKYIIMNCEKKAKFSFNSAKYNYHLKLNSDKNFANLSEYEINIINYLFNGKIGDITDINEFENKEIELNNTFEKLGKNYKETQKYNKKMQSHSNKASDEMFEKSPGNLYKIVRNFVIVIFIACTINVFLVSPLNGGDKIGITVLYTFLSIMYYAIASLIVYSSSYIVKEKYMNDYKMLIGLKKYLNDYSLIKERYPIEIALWDRYLVFATMFGIANKVSKEFKEELIKQGYDDDYIFTSYPILNMAIYSSTLNSYAAMSTGSASSGGYSGGGSGGGGRRWWRRWSLLT